MRGLLGAVVVAVSMSSVGMAEPEPADDTPTDFAALGEAPLRMNLDVAAWLVRAKGTASNGGAELEIGDDTSSSLDLGNLRGLLRGELTVGEGSMGGTNHGYARILERNRQSRHHHHLGRADLVIWRELPLLV